MNIDKYFDSILDEECFYSQKGYEDGIKDPNLIISAKEDAILKWEKLNPNGLEMGLAFYLANLKNINFNKEIENCQKQLIDEINSFNKLEFDFNTINNIKRLVRNLINIIPNQNEVLKLYQPLDIKNNSIEW